MVHGLSYTGSGHTGVQVLPEGLLLSQSLTRTDAWGQLCPVRELHFI